MELEAQKVSEATISANESSAGTKDDTCTVQTESPSTKPAVDSHPEASTSGAHTHTPVLQLKRKRSKTKLKIKTLEKKLKLLDRHIKKCTEVELTLEEMDSGTSAYMKEDLYKRKFVATWQELCELVGVSDNIESAELSGSLQYTTTPYPEINRRVQRLIKLDEFPDHCDIVDMIERCDSKHTLGIPADEKAILSRRIFKEVGKILKDRRQREFVSHFGCHLTDSFRNDLDPALRDEALLGQLKESSVSGQAKMEEVCEEFVGKQEKQEQDPGKSPDHSNEGSNEEEEEEEEENEQELIASPSNDAIDSPSVSSHSNDPMDSPSISSPSNNLLDSSGVSSPSNALAESDISDGLLDSPRDDCLDKDGLPESGSGADDSDEDTLVETVSPGTGAADDGTATDTEQGDSGGEVTGDRVGVVQGRVEGSRADSSVERLDEADMPLPVKRPKLQSDKREVIYIDSDNDDDDNEVICIE